VNSSDSLNTMIRAKGNSVSGASKSDDCF
jgi:hypothetical protein